MIEGKLINLRAREMSDIERFHAWINDREVTLHLNMRYQISMRAEEAWLGTVIGENMGFGRYTAFAIDTKDGTHIGAIDFHTASPEDRTARLGIMIGDKRYWSRGYGTDAMVTFCRFGFDEMNLERIDLTVSAENERAQACYRKCGFVEEGRLRQDRYQQGHYADSLVMGVLREEFYALHGATAA